jgi:hypothetical protein
MYQLQMLFSTERDDIMICTKMKRMRKEAVTPISSIPSFLPSPQHYSSG